MKRKKKESKKEKGRVIAVGKRKKAVARAVVFPGSGKIFVNSRPLELFGNRNEYIRLMLAEPLELAGDLAKRVDIHVNVRGGGIMGQAEAIRQAVARGLVEYYGDEDLRRSFLEYDRNLLIPDPRRTEPHHAGGASRRGSRRHKQRSKR